MAEGLTVSLTRAGPLAVEAVFQVPPGQTLALVGPSGAGKSTILKAIAGLLPTTGTVRVDGQDWQTGPHGLPAWQRRVGLVLQGGGLFPHLDALGNVTIAQTSPDRDAALALLAAMQMDGPVLGRRPAGLSGGEQMRVALARALARAPDVLLLENYITIRRLGLVDTLPAIALPYLASAFGIFLLRQTFKAIPKDFEEAARIEGCSTLGVLWRVYVPLGKPIYLAYGLVLVSFHWNNFLWPLIITNSVTTRPLTVGLAIFASVDQGIDWSIICAATLMTSGPLLIAFLLFQRQFVQSFMQAGIK